MTPGPLFELWHHATIRCLITPKDSEPPYSVDIHDGDNLVSHQVFDHHDAAVEYAVDALRRATNP